MDAAADEWNESGANYIVGRANKMEGVLTVSLDFVTPEVRDFALVGTVVKWDAGEDVEIALVPDWVGYQYPFAREGFIDFRDAHSFGRDGC